MLSVIVNSLCDFVVYLTKQECLMQEEELSGDCVVQ